MGTHLSPLRGSLSRLRLTTNVTLEQIVRTLNHPEERIKSNEDLLEEITNLDMIIDGQAYLYYTKTKQISSFTSARDFIEKRFVIKEGEVYYVFTSGVPDENYEM